MKNLILVVLLSLISNTLVKAQGDIDYAGSTVFCNPTTVNLTTTFEAGQAFEIYIDDVYSSLIDLSFPFTFYGNTYTQCHLSSNGYISFDPLITDGEYSPWPISAACPSNANPLNCIMGPWHDTDPSVSGQVAYCYLGSAPNRKFLYSFCEVAMFSCTSDIFTGQIILYEGTNVIEVHIDYKTTCLGWNDGAAIEGLQNADGTVAHIVPGRNFPDTWNADDDAKRFTPDGAGGYTISDIAFAPQALQYAIFDWTANGVSVSSDDFLDYNLTETTTFVLTTTVVTLSSLCVEIDNVTYTDTLVIEVPDDVPTFSQSNLACSASLDGEIKVEMSGDFGPWDMVWTNSAGAVLQTTNDVVADSIDFLAVGAYNVQVTNSEGCIYNHTYNITADNPVPTFAVTPANICEGSVATFTNNTGDPSLTYTWIFGDGSTQSTYNATHVYTADGNYTASLVSSFAGSCIDTTEIDIVINPKVTANASFSPGYICQKDTMFFTDLSSPTPINWHWTFGDGPSSSDDQNPFHYYTKAGMMTVTLEAASEFCGTDTFRFDVEVVKLPYNNLGEDTTICSGLSATLKASTIDNDFTYLWSTGENTSSAIISGQEADIWLMIDDRGCRTYDTIRVKTGCGVYFPNAFTPNGDNLHDFFRGIFVHVLKIDIRIFNRWGELVYQGTRLEDSWDGTFQGQEQPIGSYVYVANAVLENGENKTYYGNINLIR